MYRLFSLSLLLVLVQADPKTPKIYNVLISTKKNLSPSHALPVYEPVLRAAPLGLALPFYYHQPFAYQAITPLNLPKQGELHQPQQQYQQHQQYEQYEQHEQQQQEVDEKLSQEPLPVEQFIPFGFSPQQNIYQQQIDQLEQRTEDPKQAVANLKKNPHIPDVPPPAIPVKTS